MIIDNFHKELISLFEANMPIIEIKSYDIETIDRSLTQLFSQYEIYEFHLGDLLIDFQTKDREKKLSIFELLEKIDSRVCEKEAILLLKDIGSLLQDKQVLYYLKSIAFKQLYRENFSVTTLLIGDELDIPQTVKGLVSSILLPNPDIEELCNIVGDYISSMDIQTVINNKRDIAMALLGLDRVEALKVLNRNYQMNGSLDLTYLPIKIDKSRELVEKRARLQYIESSNGFEVVGGLSKIRGYINRVAKIYSNYDRAIQFGVDIPKGIIIYGRDGSGKGLLVKATSKVMNYPIITFNFEMLNSLDELDVILNSLSSMREAIFWVNGLNSNHFILDRLSQWLVCKEREKIFTILTTNIDLQGREISGFDEVFAVELPTERERDEIIRIHLHKRGKLSRQLDIFKIVKESRGLNGSEIESAVRRGVEDAFIENERELKTEDILHHLTKISDS